jgi:cardiolipin synthase
LNWPNRISIIRLLLVAPLVILLMNQQGWPWARHGAMGIFVVMAVSDVLDGMLARRMGARTRLGAILDPLADKVMIICAAVLLSLPDSRVPQAPLSNWVVVAIVGKDLWVIIGFVVVYLVTDRFRVRPTRAGKLCTFGQVWMVGLTLLAPDLNRLHPEIGTELARLASWAVAGLCVLAAGSYTLLGLTFVAVEEKPMEDNHGAKHQP